MNEQSIASSQELSELFKALSKAQGEMEAAKKDSENPHFKSSYADLHSCWLSIRKPLSDNSLSIIQLPMLGVETVKLRTILAHSSGQWISSTIEVKPTKTDPQGTGSALTYARRYGLSAMVGIAPEDDDANAASNPEQKTFTKPMQKPAIKANPTKGVSEAQRKRLFAISKQTCWSELDIKNYCSAHFNIESTKDLTQDQYNSICSFMMDNKK